MGISYRSYIKIGNGAKIEAEVGSMRRQMNASLAIRTPDPNNPELEINKTAELYGAGDILGFDVDKMVFKQDPKANIGNFEPNFVPSIEFFDEDFPWRYSTYKAGNNWIPWLSLIVLKKKEGEQTGEYEEVFNLKGYPKLIKLTADGSNKLPSIQECWKWAHVQKINLNGESLSSLDSEHPDRITSRIFCPRRLESNTKYVAFLVPTFKQGIAAAKGAKIGDENFPTAREEAWVERGNEGTELAIYHKWEFRTGFRGDFESMVRLLEPRILSNLGGISMKTSNFPTSMTEEMVNSDFVFRGSLIGEGQSNQEGEIQLGTLAEHLNASVATDIPEWDPSVPITEDPILTAPVYGKWYIKESRRPLVTTENSDQWYEQINLRPSNRAAAGLGAKVIRENQEVLMEAAWKRIQDVVELNDQLSHARFGEEMVDRLIESLEQLPPISALRVIWPLGGQIQTTQGTSLTTELLDLPIPSSLFNPLVNPIANKIYINQSGQIPPLNNLFPELDLDDLGGIFDGNLPDIIIDDINIFDLFRSGGANFVENIAGIGTPQSLTIDQGISSSSLANESETEAVDIAELWKHSKSGYLDSVVSIKGKITTELEVLLPNLNNWQAEQEDVETLEPKQYFPEFNLPVYKYLSKISQNYLLPGIENIPQNTVLLLESNDAFVEAFLVGMNHAFGEELRWRNYPTDMRGTYFKDFWEQLGGDRLFHDIKPIHEWKETNGLSSLGQNNPNENPELKTVFLLIRGDILNKYPNTNIFFAPSNMVDGEEKRRPDYTNAESPKYMGQLPPDITFIGFDIDKESLKEGFMVFQSANGELRFGLEERRDENQEARIFDIAWGDLGVEKGEIIADMQNSVSSYPASTSAQIAKIFTRRPVRLAVPIKRLMNKNQ